MLPRGLSMLWEPVDPGAALAERFGFDGLPAVVDWLGSTLEHLWGIRVTGCDRVVISGRNAIAWLASGDGHAPLVVKWSQDAARFAALAAQATLLRAIAERGVPVAAPLAAVDGRARAVVEGAAGPVSIAVTPEVAGDWLDIRDATAVRNAGACLAHLHAALRSAPSDAALEAPETGALPARIASWLEHGDRGFAPEATRRLAGLVARAPDLGDDIQLVHNDYRSANILTRHARVVAVLDFDEMVRAHPVADLAWAGVLLATRFTDWAPTPVDVRRMLVAGYESVRPLSDTETVWLEILTLWNGIRQIPGVGADDPQGWGRAV